MEHPVDVIDVACKRILVSSPKS